MGISVNLFLKYSHIFIYLIKVKVKSKDVTFYKEKFI